MKVLRKTWKGVLAAAAAVVLCAALLLSGCSSGPYVTGIARTGGDGAQDVYTVYYSDGSTTSFTVENGADGADLNIEDVYQSYCDRYGEIEFSDFLEMYLDVNAGDNTAVIQKSLQSAVTVYAEFCVTQSGGWPFGSTLKGLSQSIGSGVIYEIDEDYVYFVTNYHVVYNSSANSDNGSNIGRKLVVYLYGSEGEPDQVYNQTDELGYPVLDYGSNAIECEYVGGTYSNDLAVLRADKDDVFAINDSVAAATVADGYTVGQTAIAIGNTEAEGISVTEGIVSVEREAITFTGGRTQEVLRIDTAIYSGNSGGGLFDLNGQLIGITNGGNEEDQNINYAIPVQVVRGSVENILFHANDGDDKTNGLLTPTLGITVTSQNSRYIYDAAAGSGKIYEDIVVSEAASGSIASDVGIRTGDLVRALFINGQEYDVARSYDIGDLRLILRPGDTISFTVEREGEQLSTGSYTINSDDFSVIS